MRQSKSSGSIATTQSRFQISRTGRSTRRHRSRPPTVGSISGVLRARQSSAIESYCRVFAVTSSISTLDDGFGACFPPRVPGKAIDCLREVAASLGWKRTLRTHVFGPLSPLHRGLRRQLPEFLTPKARELHFARPLWPKNLDFALRPHQASRLLALLDARGEGFERHFSNPFGVEMRSPLRDFDLVQFMLAVPDHLLQQGTVTRPILRAASRGLIPEEIRLRKSKAAFYDVLDRGMATEKLRWTRSLLLDPDALWRGFIEESAIRSWVEASPTDNWRKMGYLHAIYGELWRRERAGLPRPSADAAD